MEQSGDVPRQRDGQLAGDAALGQTLAVQVEQIDVVRLEALEAGLDFAQGGIAGMPPERSALNTFNMSDQLAFTTAGALSGASVNAKVLANGQNGTADEAHVTVGTGNKTEILLGYTTLFGDSACAINPLGDLYKTQVRQLSAAMGVPEALITKAPSADLWVGQTDEGELGFTYAEADRLLYLLVDQRYTPADCVEAGFPEEFVDSVVERIRRNQFKRMLPPIAKLSNRTVGYDFLYLRDWGT